MPDRLDPGVFLQKRSYRRRRILDGLRMLPIVGAWLFLMPILWAQGGTSTASSGGLASAVTYIFIVWIGLIALALSLLLTYRILGGDTDDRLEMSSQLDDGTG